MAVVFVALNVFVVCVILVAVAAAAACEWRSRDNEPSEAPAEVVW